MLSTILLTASLAAPTGEATGPVVIDLAPSSRR
jgi:hypothetical protein